MRFSYQSHSKGTGGSSNTFLCRFPLSNGRHFPYAWAATLCVVWAATLCVVCVYVLRRGILYSSDQQWRVSSPV